MRRVALGATEYRLTLVRWAGDRAVVRLDGSPAELTTDARILRAAGLRRAGDVLTFAGWPSDFRPLGPVTEESPTASVTITSERL